MSLITYAEVRPWAKGIVRQVSDGVMPPWHADAPHGTFRNERGLTAAQKDLIERWAAADAPEGNPADLPPVPAFTSGWGIGQPDAIFEMQEDYPVPANGTIEYEHFYIPTNFTEERWLQAIEARPGNRSLVHHVLVYYETPPDGPRTPPVLQPNRQDSRITAVHGQGNRPQREGNVVSRLLATYAPGTRPQVFPAGTALRLPPGGVLHLQMHYTANGKAGTDRIQGRPDLREAAARTGDSRFAVPQRAVHDSGGGIESRGEHGRDVRAGCHARRALPAHTRSREAMELHARTTRRHDEVDPLGAEVRLQLADLLHV